MGRDSGYPRAVRRPLPIVAIALLARAAVAEPAPPPPGPLACLARHYAVTPALDGGRWFARLPDGKTIPYDDGRAKSFEEKLAAPDVEDAFSIRYRGGAIRPVEKIDDDPGRIRLDPVFQATYPTGGKDMTTVELLGRKLRVHRKVAARFEAVGARLAKALAADPSLGPFLSGVGGTFVRRNIAGTDRPSSHSYGVSLDINAERSEYWRWQRPPEPIKWRNRVPQAIVDAFEAEGFIWGGRWYHYDTMHFEYRPELLDPACYPPGR